MSKKNKNPFPVFEHFNELRQVLLKEPSDRATAIIGGAMIDEILGIALRSRMREDVPGTGEGGTEFLMGRNGPLGAHGVRIRMAFAIGIVSEDSYGQLLVLNDIRNAFAHTLLSHDI